MPRTIQLQTRPIFAKFARECRLVEALRRKPWEGFLYSCARPMVLEAIPDEGILVVNGDEVEVPPAVIEPGDLVVWIPGVGGVC
jgi:hypothetical protein